MTKASGFTALEKWTLENAIKARRNRTRLRDAQCAPDTERSAEPADSAGLRLQGHRRCASRCRRRRVGRGLRLDLGFAKGHLDRALDSGDADVVLQTVPQAIPELPKVPLAISFAKTDDARQLIQAGIHDVADLTYSYVLPPRTPKDRVEIVRKAFTDTMKDAEFIADTKKSRLGIDPMTGEELGRTDRASIQNSAAGRRKAEGSSEIATNQRKSRG